MDLKSQKSPRSNRSTPFASPKVEPRPRNAQPSPIPMRKASSGACVHRQNTQTEGSCLEEDLTIAKTFQAHGMPVQLTTKPLQRTSKAAAPASMLKNISTRNTQSRAAGKPPTSESRSIRSSLMASPPNSPSGPDPPGAFCIRKYYRCRQQFDRVVCLRTRTKDSKISSFFWQMCRQHASRTKIWKLMITCTTAIMRAINQP